MMYDSGISHKFVFNKKRFNYFIPNFCFTKYAGILILLKRERV